MWRNGRGVASHQIKPLRARLAARADSPRFDDDPDRVGEGNDASASPSPDFQERLAFACGLSLVMPDGLQAEVVDLDPRVDSGHADALLWSHAPDPAFDVYVGSVRLATDYAPVEPLRTTGGR